MSASLFLGDDLIGIRPFNRTDALAVFQAVQENDANLAYWPAELGSSTSVANVHSYIDAQIHAWALGSAYNFAVVDSLDTEVWGGCGLSRIDRLHRFANLHYWTRSSKRQTGIATRAVRLLLQFAFTSLDLLRVEILIAESNSASMRVAEKVNAVLEGTLRNRVFQNGSVQNALLYSIIPSDR